MTKAELRRRMLDAKDKMMPLLRVVLGPHLCHFVFVVDYDEGNIALHGEPKTKTAGERYFITNASEVIENTYMQNLDVRLDRLRNFLDRKHREHLSPAA